MWCELASASGHAAGWNLGPLQILGLYGGIPLAVIVAVIVGVYVPSWARGRPDGPGRANTEAQPGMRDDASRDE